MTGAPEVPSPTLFECLDVCLSFGGLQVLDGVSMRAGEGEIVGIIGPNGAGKTTLLNVVSGFLRADTGRVLLGGKDISGLLPYERAALGLGRTFQQALLYPSLTVAENLLVSAHRHTRKGLLSTALRRRAAVAEERAAAERVVQTMDVIDLAPYWGAKAGALSYGTLRMLELACLLAQTPRFLLLDEPASGIAQKETEALGPLLARVREETGTTILLIEHDIPLIAGLSDRMYAMDLGRVIAAGTPGQVLEHPAVVASYLGSKAAARPGRPGAARARAGRARTGGAGTGRARTGGAGTGRAGRARAAGGHPS
ncbi:MAG: ABC transporter ATP-binding protein [Acidobacteria bacterium]|nr:ABC transporter ATP-binding protein [Acidobacteriota bacterium]